jgi:hypothetical protein
MEEGLVSDVHGCLKTFIENKLQLTVNEGKALTGIE